MFSAYGIFYFVNFYGSAFQTFDFLLHSYSTILCVLFLICCKPFYIRSCVLFRNCYASINVFKNFVFYVWTSTFCIYIVSWCAWLAMYVFFSCDFVMSIKKLFQSSGSVADEVGIVSVFFIFRWLSLILHSERIYIWASHFSLFLYFFARCFSVLYLWPVYYSLVCKSHTTAPDPK